MSGEMQPHEDPQNQQEMAMDENQPLLFVDVNLGVGKQERIVVCEGDRADELAERFAAMHSNYHPHSLTPFTH